MNDPELKLLNDAAPLLPEAVTMLDMLLPDSNGVLRGKRLTKPDLAGACRDGVALPGSLFSLDLQGRQAALRDFPQNQGDRDYICRPVPGSIGAVPWIGPDAAQCLLDMYDGDDLLPVSPRAVLRRCVARLADSRLTARLAIELEFYLFEAQLDARGRPGLARNPASGEIERVPRVYDAASLDDYSAFLATAAEWAAAQHLPIIALQSEYGPGQFEINLDYQDDPLLACDQAVFFKRLVKQAARRHGFRASFMARPRADIPGCGLHLHVNLRSTGGDNLFAARPASLSHAIGGLQQHLDDSLLLFAPHANSYRRFVDSSFAPRDRSWASNDRRAAIRIPASADAARRLEHRIAGADANPYLAVAGVLAGIASGLENGTEPAPQGTPKASFTDGWQAARRRFAAADWAREHFGEAFCANFAALKLSEQMAFEQLITPFELEWGLDAV